MKNFELIHGNRDCIDVLEAAIEDVKAGRLVGLALAKIWTEEGKQGFETDFAWKDDLSNSWAMLVATVANANNTLMSGDM